MTIDQIAVCLLFEEVTSERRESKGEKMGERRGLHEALMVLIVFHKGRARASDVNLRDLQYDKRVFLPLQAAK